MTRNDPPAHPLQGVDGDPPPPRREQLPLPQRERLTHLEPQLRTPHSSGDGTPFAAFESEESGATGDAGEPDDASTASGRHARRSGVDSSGAEGCEPNDESFPTAAFPAAAFVEGSRRAADAAATPPLPWRPARPAQGSRPRRPCGRDQASGPPGSGGTASR
ncbi:hypothetical protein [Pseudonocardia sp. GCM10023141]|uniref:hypothetical protein n=1 Tax=Pseudonocardia sp. GCM10023141 TaxID=3252653 RepID=UPI00361AF3A4